MKTIFRFLSIATVFAGLGATAAFAQDACADVDGQTALYTKVTGNYLSKTVEGKKAALEASKQFLEKYGSCTALKDQIDFVKSQLARLEGLIAKQIEQETLGAFFKRYDAGISGKNYDEAYAAGREILTKQPENLNVMVPLGVIGLYESYNKNYKYNDDTLRYARKALDMLKSGAQLTKTNKSGVPTVGVFQFEYPKEDAIAELTYALAYINYYGKNDKKAALPYYYEVSQNGRYKTDPRVYATIGSYYIEDASKLGQEIAGLIAKQKAAATDDEKAALDTEIKAKVALFNGYAERSLDAYSRAYKNAKDDTPANKTYKAELYKILQDIYKRRFDKVDGLDAYVAETVAKPLPNPTTEVTPVTEPEPAKTTSSTAPASSAPASTAAVSAAPAVKPAAASTTGTKVPSKKTVAVKKNR